MDLYGYTAADGKTLGPFLPLTKHGSTRQGRGRRNGKTVRVLQAVGEPVAVTCRAQCSGGSAAAAVAMTVSCLGGVGESHGRSPRWMQAGRRKRSRRSTAGRRENRKTTGRQRLRRQREKRATLVDERRRLEEGRKEAEAWRWERMSEVEQVGAACL